MHVVYEKGIDLKSINTGDKIWYKPCANTYEEIKIEEGIVTYVDGNRVWAVWEDESHLFINISTFNPISYGTVKSAEGKQYRLAVFCEESPIIITCNHIDFQKEFEESKGFVHWLTEWIDW